MTLHDIGLKHGTDKAWHHGYTHTYAALFAPLRQQPITLLELGYHQGASARMWAEYFPHGHIYCIDINEPPELMPARTVVMQADQADAAALARLHAASGDYDIIVDDASHLSSKTIASFKSLWPTLKPGGHYIVEDTHGAYHDFYYGPTEADPNPDTTVPTTMRFLKRLADEVNAGLFPDQYRLGYSIESLCFQYNLAIIRKSA